MAEAWDIDYFSNQFLPTVELPLALFHLGLDQRPESFLKELNNSGLFRSPVSIRLYQDRLEMRRPILNFLLLVLGVFLDSALDIIHVKPRVSKNLLKQSFELRPRQRNFSAKEKSYNRVRLVPVVPVVLKWSSHC